LRNNEAPALNEAKEITTDSDAWKNSREQTERTTAEEVDGCGRRGL